MKVRTLAMAMPLAAALLLTTACTPDDPELTTSSTATTSDEPDPSAEQTPIDEDPIDITGKEGEAFTIGDIDYQAGWKFKDDAQGNATVVDLKATNNDEESLISSVTTFEFWRDTELLSEISCNLLDELPAGATATLGDCVSEHSVPDLHNKITVRN